MFGNQYPSGYPNVMQRPLQPPLSGLGQGIPSGLGTAQPPPSTLLRTNPDGSAPPVGGNTLPPSGPSMVGNPAPTGTLTSALGLGGGNLQNLVNTTPTAILNTMFDTTGQDKYGGLLQTLQGIMSNDQLNTLVSILTANSGAFGSTPDQSANTVARIYQNLIGGGSLPTLQQLFGGVFANPTGGGAGNNPFIGLLTGGTPGQQAGMLGGAISDMLGALGYNPLNARAMNFQLDQLMTDYIASQGVSGANMSFVDYLKRNAPNMVGFLTGA